MRMLCFRQVMQEAKSRRPKGAANFDPMSDDDAADLDATDSGVKTNQKKTTRGMNHFC